MDIQSLLDNVRDLTDLELAILLSLIAQQNCLITTEEDLIDDLSSELALIASETFKLSYAVISQEDSSSVETFGEAILDQNHDHDFGRNNSTSADYLVPHSRLASVHVRAASVAPSLTSHQAQHNLDSRTVANVVIAKNFNHASREVQIAALELITRRRIFSRTTVHQVPKTFVFIPIVSSTTKHVRLNSHLNDRISISHYHDAEDGFANLEELDPQFSPDVSKDPQREDDRESNSSSSSSVVKPDFFNGEHQAPTRQIHHSVVEKLREMGQQATITPEIRRHIQDIIVFLRIARGVDGGVTPFATTQLVNLARYLAPLHGLDFVTPGLVALAVRKVYPHRIVITSPDRERSMQWGSDREAIAEVLNGLTPEAIIEDVLSTVPSPV